MTKNKLKIILIIIISILILGLSPSIESTSGLLIFPKNCLA